MRRIFFILLPMILLITGSLYADPMKLDVDQIIYQTGVGVDSSQLSGDIYYDEDTGIFCITNTSPDSAFDNSDPGLMLLTGFGIQIGNLDITGGEAYIADGSSAVNFIAPSNNVISNQWGYANKAVDGFNSIENVLAVDAVVSTVASVGPLYFAPNNSIGGPAYGALSADETEFSNNNYAAVLDTICFALNFNGDAPSFDDVNRGNVVLAFGSPNAVPEGGSIILMIGLGFSGIAFLKRKLG